LVLFPRQIDIHWSLGDFGYFPTYALGNHFSAHFFAAFTKEHPNWEDRIRANDLSFLRQWLKNNIHSYGRTYNSEELAKKATSKSFSEKAYCNYLKKKYGALYGF
jgi:carboxypeptidase Taq